MDINFYALLAQLTLGLVNGAFYALLCLGLSIIFGMLFVINFAHGAQYMMGAFISWILLQYLGIGFWPSLLISPIIVGFVGVAIEILFLRRAYKLDHIFGLLLTVGIAVVIEGTFYNVFGGTGNNYDVPASLSGGFNLGYMYLPKYRAFVFVISALVCLASWLMIEKTQLGSYLRAATEKPELVRAFGIKVPILFTATYGFSVGLAALAGVLAAPIQQVSPFMGSHIMDAVFAVVVIGGMGSLRGAIITGFGVGFLEGLTKYFYPEAASTVVFFLMVLVLIFRPMGLFGKTIVFHPQSSDTAKLSLKEKLGVVPSHAIGAAIVIALVIILPFFMYYVTLLQILIMALFAAALNLTFGYGGLLSFGHAMFFGTSCYIAGHVIKVWNWPPELGILMGVLAATAVGIVVGGLAIRRKAIYFAMITLAFSQIVIFFANQFSFTGGEDGLQAIPRGVMFGLFDLQNSTTLYAVVAIGVLLGFLVIYRIVHSPYGHVLRSIRDNEERAIALGYNTERLRLVAFILSASLSGYAGGLNILVTQNASLSNVSAALSGDVLFMNLIGGIGTIFGPFAGAAVLIGMQTYFSTMMGTWVRVVQGVIFVLCVMTFRQGIIGQVSKFFRRPL